MPSAVQTSGNARETRQKLSLEQRSRSIPYKRPFVVAVLATLLFYLGLIAFCTSVVTFFLAPIELRRGAAYTLVTLLPICGFLWTVAYFKRRKATCPLCKCTPFLDNLAHKHQKSFRVRPLNYGTTAVLNVMISQRWRCMYCGTPFDILKTKKGHGYVADQDNQTKE
ncbi:MAG: hypothetical protein H7A51_16405 [Akkermansiaceae bacterium]|nr:hypothetical protein [Akkermansiaceae bacterium]